MEKAYDNMFETVLRCKICLEIVTDRSVHFRQHLNEWNTAMTPREKVE